LKSPVEFDRILSHHKEHEDREGWLEKFKIPLRVLRALRG
jgi:hypothetical protein